MIKYLCFLTIIAVLAVSCSSESYKKVKEWVPVAVVDGNNVGTQNRVRSTLKRHSIICYMEGSLGNAVMVPKKRLNEAKKALLEDTELRGPWLIILEDGAIPKSNWKTNQSERGEP